MQTRLPLAFQNISSPTEIKPAKRLYLLSHADDPEQGFGLDDDLDPPLGTAALEELSAVQRFMVEAGYEPDLILSSRTRRARDIVDFLTGEFKREPRVSLQRAVHYGSTLDMIDSVRAVDEPTGAVLLITSAKRISPFALKLSRGYGPTHARAARHRMLAEFPPGALAALNVSVETWDALAPKAGLVHSFTRPADLLPRDH